MKTEKQAKEILNYVLDSFDIKNFKYIGQKEILIKDIENYLENKTE